MPYQQFLTQIPHNWEAALWGYALALGYFTEYPQPGWCVLKFTPVSWMQNLEEVGVGDGSTTYFSGTLSYFPIKPGSVTLEARIGGLSVELTDDGILPTGTLSGGGHSGSINYADGSWEVTFTDPPDNTTTIEMGFSHATGPDEEVSVQADENGNFVHEALSPTSHVDYEANEISIGIIIPLYVETLVVIEYELATVFTGTLRRNLPTIYGDSYEPFSGVIAKNLPCPNVSAAGIAGISGSLQRRVPAVRCSAEGRSAIVGNLSMVLPALTIGAQAITDSSGGLGASLPALLCLAYGKKGGRFDDYILRYTR